MQATRCLPLLKKLPIHWSDILIASVFSPLCVSYTILCIQINLSHIVTQIFKLFYQLLFLCGLHALLHFHVTIMVTVLLVKLHEEESLSVKHTID